MWAGQVASCQLVVWPHRETRSVQEGLSGGGYPGLGDHPRRAGVRGEMGRGGLVTHPTRDRSPWLITVVVALSAIQRARLV